MKPVLQVDQLEVAFEKTVISGVSFNVYEGMTTAIVGESGSGKTVTSIAIMGLLPSNGRVKKGEVLGVGGVTWIKAGEIPNTPVGREISMVFQDPMSSLNPSMRVGQQVAEPLEIHLGLGRSDSMERAIELFKEVELPEPESAINKYPHELSGGQKQRVMIAIALACNPKILVADEPTTALDVTVQKTILELLVRLQRERGLGILFISHDLDVVRDVADFVVVMKDGAIVEQGKCSEVLENPSHPYTLDLLSSKPKREGAEVEIKDLDVSPLIEVKELVLDYVTNESWLGKVKEKFTAVNGVTLQIHPGERVGLVGESGCGKSTTAKMLLNIEEPTKGKIFFRGKDISTFNAQEWQEYRKKVQIIFQDPYSSLNPRWTVGKIIAEPLLLNTDMSKKEIVARVYEIMKKVGLERDWYDRFPHQFSGGQRQRIGIARALVLNPEVIVCDEPVSALDVSIQAQVLNLLLDLQEEFDLTYVFISHDLGVVEHISDRIMVMYFGDIVELSTVDELFENPKADYTKKLLSAIPTV